jgi:phenylalanyl-tRNA synthetase alpha chain
VTSGAADLARGLDPAWERADPAHHVPDWAARLEAISSSDASLAEAVVGFAGAMAAAKSEPDLTQRFAAVLGRERGSLTDALASLPKLEKSERQRLGKALNLAKTLLTDVRAACATALKDAREAGGGEDVTLPGRRSWVGRRHVLQQIYDELLDLFHGLGYSVYTSPEVESEAYNFTKLNFPQDHPARDAHDTYFVAPRETGGWDGEPRGEGAEPAPTPGRLLLRTHTSPGWVRAMEERKPPLRLVFPGRVYRAEQVDASHMDQFHQIDGLCVDRNISMADLKGTLDTFARAIYGEGVRTRFIPIYFPFVEPGAQLDVSCVICGGSGSMREDGAVKRCVVCKGSGWLEVLGAGMVHPNVFRAVGYDPEEFTGFAFGMGVERIAMLRYGIPEIRLFLENDERFLRQFPR